MTDREKMELRGPAHTIKSETMEFDKEQGEWKQPFYSTQTAFNRDGSTSELLYYNPDGSVLKTAYVYDGAGLLLKTRSQMNDGVLSETLYHYDDLGRLHRVVSTGLDGTSWEEESYHYDADGWKTKLYLPTPDVTQRTEGSVCYGFEGSDHSYCAQGTSTVTTVYDPSGKPVEIMFHDARHVLLVRAVALYDDRGRRIEEAQYSGDEPPFKLPPGVPVDPQAQRVLEEVFAPGRLMSRTRYGYNDEDRCIETTSEELLLDSVLQRTSFTYDEYGNKIFERHSGESESFSIDEAGNKIRDDRPSRNDNLHYDALYEYEYDPQQNWTQRVISLRYKSAQSFEPSNMVRRGITYY